MEKQEFTTKSAGQTQKLAGKISKELLSVKERKTAAILALEGELGGGKTTFTQGLAKALGVKEKITSPTFVIMRRFTIYDLSPSTSLRVKFKNRTENNKLFPKRSPAVAGRSRRVSIDNLFHIDCYRLDNSKDLVDLGFNEILKDPKNLIVIEWADKVKSLIPQDAVWVEFEWKGEEEREIIVF